VRTGRPSGLVERAHIERHAARAALAACPHPTNLDHFREDYQKRPERDPPPEPVPEPGEPSHLPVSTKTAFAAAASCCPRERPTCRDT
jgi:hypothetical protein